VKDSVEDDSIVKYQMDVKEMQKKKALIG